MGERDVKQKKPADKPAAPPVGVIYEAVQGINYGPDSTRIEPGAVVPAEVIDAAPWLLQGGHVRIRKEATNG